VSNVFGTLDIFTVLLMAVAAILGALVGAWYGRGKRRSADSAAKAVESAAAPASPAFSDPRGTEPSITEAAGNPGHSGVTARNTAPHSHERDASLAPSSTVDRAISSTPDADETSESPPQTDWGIARRQDSSAPRAEHVAAQHATEEDAAQAWTPPSVDTETGPSAKAQSRIDELETKYAELEAKLLQAQREHTIEYGRFEAGAVMAMDQVVKAGREREVQLLGDLDAAKAELRAANDSYALLERRVESLQNSLGERDDRLAALHERLTELEG